MKCIKCGKRINKTKCEACGFDLGTEPFYFFSLSDIKNLDSINRFIKKHYSFDLTSEVNSSVYPSNTKSGEPTLLAGRLLTSITIGSTLFFGNYYISTANIEKMPIEWLVLDEKPDKILVISKYAIDLRRYNTSVDEVAWAECSLHQWLNNDFYDTAFSFDEKNSILNTVIRSDKLMSNGTTRVYSSNDKVFLLSAEEKGQYFASKETRDYAICFATSYTDLKIINDPFYADQKRINEHGACYWWLRSPGTKIRVVDGKPNYVSEDYRKAANVSDQGDVEELYSTLRRMGVRPAMWLKK